MSALWRRQASPECARWHGWPRSALVRFLAPWARDPCREQVSQGATPDVALPPRHTTAPRTPRRLRLRQERICSPTVTPRY